MFMRIVLIPAIVGALVALSSHHVMSQSKEDGVSLFNEAGQLYQKAQTQSDVEKAIAKYEQARIIFEKTGVKKGLAEVANNLGRIHAERGQYEKALDYFQESLALARELKDRRGEGHRVLNLGIIYGLWGQYGKAVDYLERSLAISRDLDDRAGEAQGLHNLGSVYGRWGQYDKGIGYLEKSLAIHAELKDRRGEAGTLTNLGNIYYESGQYSKSTQYYRKSLAVKADLKDRKGLAASLNALGWVYLDWGQYDKALEYYDKSLAISRDLRTPLSEGNALMGIGSVYSHRGDVDKALANFQRCLEIYRAIGASTDEPIRAIGDLYLDKGDVDRAEPLLKEAGYNSSLGRLHLLKSDYQGAREYYDKIRQSAETNRNMHNLFTAYTGLGMAYEGLGDDEKAEQYFLRAVNLTEELRSTLPKAQRETFFDVRISGFLRTAPYDGLARVRVRMNRPVEAFKDSEYTKSRIFAETMSKWSESTSFDIPQAVVTQDRELNDQLAALKKKRQEGYEKANQEVISVMEPQVQEMEKKFQAHVKMLREQYPLFAATKYPEPMGLDQTSLKDAEWVLAYHVTDPGIIIYLTKGKEIVKAVYKPLPRAELDSLVLTFRKPLEIVPGRDSFDEKLKSFDLAAGKKLSDVLLSDITDSLPVHVPLLIVPDDSLGTLPFEMLVLNDQGTIKTDKELPYVSGAEFFGDRNRISYCQSVTALTLSRIHAKAKGTQAGLLAIADPVFQEKDERVAEAPKKEAPTGVMASLFKRLNLMAAEEDGLMGGLRFPRLHLTAGLAKALSETHRKGADIYTGFDASKDNFLKKISPSLNRYDEVVFATHGYFGKDLPGIMEPVLVLTLIPPGTDGYLRMTEVMGLNMNADIVALTACQTGLGKRTSGEGTMGMGRAFQYAGARSVLMSLWSVSEVASVNLVKSFFRNLKEGKSKSEALAAARAELRKKGFDHPFFWAAFILVGEVR